MQQIAFSKKRFRDCISLTPSASRQNNTSIYDSFKKINTSNFKQRKSNFKGINTQTIIQKNQNHFGFVNQKDNDLLNQRDSLQTDTESAQLQKTKQKGVRFRDRVSIEQRDSLLSQKNKIFADITNDKIEMLNSIALNKNLNLPMTSRRRAPQNVKIVSDLLNSPVQSKNTIINELKCFMCHYPDQNSILFGKRTISLTKQRLLQVDKNQQAEPFFRYDAFGNFLKIMSQLSYDSHEVITAYETLLNKYTYPASIKIMLYYMGSFLYQINSMYDRSEIILKRMLNEVFKFKLFQYVGIYLVLIIKMKANLLDWQACTNYLMKLLAYSWLYKFQNLQIWAYFELSRAYFFLNLTQQSEYFKIRSEMCIIEPSTNIYREMIAQQFKNQMQYMRAEHKFFNFENKISICELFKIEEKQKGYIKEKDTFKLQSQIKSINQHCKIKHVKNILSRMNSGNCQEAMAFKRISSKDNFFASSKTSRNLAGNPLLRTHESGLKNLNIYFRRNTNGQSLLGKNRQAKLYTFENNSKNMLALKQLSRNILLEMKWFIPINLHEN